MQEQPKPVDYEMLVPSMAEINDRDVRQFSVLNWCKAAFAGPDEAASDTQLLRFIEEALELAQAHGLPADLIQHQLAITYARPKGERHQEIGGVMVTINAYCEAVGESLALCERDEIARCNAKPIEHFQRRQREKREAGL